MNWTTIYRDTPNDGGGAGAGGGAAGGGVPGAGVGAGAPPAGAVGPWYAGKVDAETIGHWQNLGIHEKSAEEIAMQMTKSHREAQKYIGTPVHQLVKLPGQEGDAEGWKQVFTKLGKPADGSGYDFNGIKHIDDKPLDLNFDQAMRAAALDGNLTKAQAASVLRGVVKHLDSQRSSELAAAQQKLTEEKTTLDKSWGLNKAQNLLVAQSGARTLGIKPEVVAALEGQMGYAGVMEMFRAVGSKMGEDQFIGGSGPGGNGVMTREQAVAKRADLMADKGWSKSYLAKDADKIREMTNLIAIINA